MKKKSVILICIFIACLSFACQENRSQNTLIIGTNPTYPPYESVNASGELEGFDIDLANEIAKKLGKNCAIKETCFDALILSLQLGKIDMIISGMSITKSRKKQIAMIPYQGEKIQSLKLAFWNKIPESVASIEDVKGPIAVQVATYQNGYLDEIAPNQSKALQGSVDLIMDIQYGKSSAALFEPHIADSMKEMFPELQFISIPLPEDRWLLGNGIGIKKDNDQLVAQTLEVIHTLKKEGVIEELEKKWLGGKNDHASF